MNKSVFSGNAAPGNSGAFLCALFTDFGRVPVVLRDNYRQLSKSVNAMIPGLGLSNHILYI
jgi:hypothetical protein